MAVPLGRPSAANSEASEETSLELGLGIAFGCGKIYLSSAFVTEIFH